MFFMGGLWVTLYLTVSLSQPIISIRAPEGELVLGPLGPEVPWGQSFSIVCTTEPQEYQGGSFHLTSDGSAEIWTELAVNHSASFYFPKAEFILAGNYSCIYEVTLATLLLLNKKKAKYVVNEEHWPMSSFEVPQSSYHMKTKKIPNPMDEEHVLH
ncbi:hypothetical protein AALO_G00046290 [Alosa alosa]|uniref:Ig-like domain-containing protein n=1 Tax=Alosa alosa TaxID=278164 RepID=A0AAV6H9N1_9TELE|nr:hypothetical protein AALO_G00046290 [Alosa alosa]